MASTSWGLLAGLGVALAACAAKPTAPEADCKFRSSTTHFRLCWQSPTISETEIATLRSALERGLGKIRAFLGAQSSLSLPVRLHEKGGAKEAPHVDSNGVIHLYRFDTPMGGLLQGIPHEIVHALRHERNTRLYGRDLDHWPSGAIFVEEGFAEFVASEIAGPHTSFSTFGRRLDLLAGYWLATGQSIPLDTLFRNPELAPKCAAQSYPLRASFVKFLFEEGGKTPLLALMNHSSPFVPELLPRFFRYDAERLFSLWRRWALRRYRALRNTEAALIDLRKNTPIFRMPLCKAGADW